ncbi:MAG: alanine--tRNA ligase [bacterium]|nr:alanine--tRNA ligase [bacterium]
MKARELRKKYLKFFESRGHAIVPSAFLAPENDPTTLFTGSGMQPMVPYLLGEKHPLGTRIANSQKCFRSQDIEDVGDNRHTTFFEMLGNWSFGDYFKKEQIAWIFEFLTKEIGLDPKNIYITVFRGNDELGIPRDCEAVLFWQKEFAKIGMEARDVDFAENRGMQGGRIFYYGEDKNWWSRVGAPNNMPPGEPGGPDSEMFWDFGAGLGIHEKSEYRDELCHVNCDCGRFLEIGNNVFMQYVKTEKGFRKLPAGNIDLGAGLERILAAKNGDPDIFKTDLFVPIINKIEKISGKKYGESASAYDMRVIADHLKAAAFLIADGVAPSNVQQGYVLRRLIRRAIRYGHLLGIENNFTKIIAEAAIEIYKNDYPELEKNKGTIFAEFEKEENRFRETLEKGIKEFNKLTKVTGADAFNLYQSYGFPFEMTEELAKEKNFMISKNEFKKELEKHQNLSRTASAGLFSGGLSDTSEITVKYHTATHLLLAALRKILGTEIYQKGSNITSERLRFDFNYAAKLTAEQLKKAEDLVNAKIQENIPVKMAEMAKNEALKIAKVSFDPAKYGDVVKVYKISDFSVELCGGPHVKNTGELGRFKIIKEESSSSGVRRIKAILI